MALVQRFALVLGAVYLVVGLAGFIPPLLSGELEGVEGPLAGNLLGIFAVNWLHDIVHILIGIYGLSVFRSFNASRTYALVIGLAYAGVFLIGILSPDVGTLGGYLPLNTADDILHIATAVVALGLYFMSREEPARGAV